jgi:allantoicase
VSVLGSCALPDDEHGWALVPFDIPVLPRTRLGADTRHVFNVNARAVTALRVQAYPDGGIARVRALGTPTELGVQLLRTRWEGSS